MVVVRGLDLLVVIEVDEVVVGCKMVVAVVRDILAEDIVVERTAAVVVVEIDFLGGCCVQN